MTSAYVFCAVLYVLKTGYQWRQVPGDFPEWRSAYNYYKIWSTKAEPTADSLLEQVLKKLSLLGELTKDVQLLTSFIIIPIFWRICCQFFSVVLICFPSKVIVPCRYSSRPLRQRIKVLFPDPDGPNSVTTSSYRHEN